MAQAEAKIEISLSDVAEVKALLGAAQEEIRLLRKVVCALFEGAQRSGATVLMFQGTSEDIEAMRDATNRALELEG